MDYGSSLMFLIFLSKQKLHYDIIHSAIFFLFNMNIFITTEINLANRKTKLSNN